MFIAGVVTQGRFELPPSDRRMTASKKGGKPQARGSSYRRLAKLTTGQRTRVEVISKVPRPVLTAALISSSLLSSVGVTPCFHLKICKFQAPPEYPISVGMKFSTLQPVGSCGSAASSLAH